MIYNQNLPTSFVSSSSSFTIVFAFVNRKLHDARCIQHKSACVLGMVMRLFLFSISETFWKDSSEFSISLFHLFVCHSSLCLFQNFTQIVFNSMRKNSLTPVFWFGFPNSKVEYVNLWKIPCVCAKLVYIHDDI